MANSTRQTGRQGEHAACDFLTKNGYKIIQRNFTSPHGEIDIIAEDEKYIVFVEVKTRTSEKFGLPRESVTEYKQNKIRLTATLYLQTNNLLNQKVRFDVVEVLDEEIEHIVGCF